MTHAEYRLNPAMSPLSTSNLDSGYSMDVLRLTRLSDITSWPWFVFPELLDEQDSDVQTYCTYSLYNHACVVPVTIHCNGHDASPLFAASRPVVMTGRDVVHHQHDITS